MQTKHQCVLLHLMNSGLGWRRETGLSPPLKYFTGRSKAVLLLWSICAFLSCVSHAFASIIAAL